MEDRLGYPARSLIFRDENIGFNSTPSALDAAYDMGQIPSLSNIPHTRI